MRPTMGSLFAGIGGFDLGFERAGFQTVWQVEINDYCRKVLAKHFPYAERFSDIRDCGANNLKPVDVICGGFPCQPFSTASRGRKVATDLFPEMLRIVEELRPRYVVAENVSLKAISNASGALEGLGYYTHVRCISAALAGADHQRDRWWVIAHPHDKGELCRSIHAEMEKLPELCDGLWGAANYGRAIRISDGTSNRVDRLRALGNAVVPQIPELIARRLIEVL